MKVLLCCENFPPSVGGVQKMMYELGKQFVAFGHDVSVVTSWHKSRDFEVIDGIKVYTFKVQGNYSNGLTGEVNQYQNFLVNGDFDCLLVMAAQQWTLDAMLPVLKDIKYIKLHIPCGYSGFYQKKYESYYNDMKGYISDFDNLIYNASDYRDINFAKSLELDDKINIIPAGASEEEFAHNPELNIRKKLGISDNDFIFLSVGNPPYSKGHKEILKSYDKANLSGNSVLILNGNYEQITTDSFKEWIKDKAKYLLGRSPYSIKKLANRVNAENKKVLFTNLSRNEVISLFFESDLFLFASHVEYSPLVIYECLASGLPFISIPVGNTKEIVNNSHGGVICDAKVYNEGFTRANPKVFARAMEQLFSDRVKLKELHVSGRLAWEQYYTWQVIAQQIEKLFTKKQYFQGKVLSQFYFTNRK